MIPSGPGPVAPGLHAALVRNTGYLISRCGVYATRHFSERMEAIGLTPRMWGALNVLDAEGAVSQQQLGKAIGMDPSSMVGTIDELESRGLVQRRPHPTDRRVHALHLTDAGRDILTSGRGVARAAQEELLAPLDAEDRARLHDLLLRIAEATHDAAGRGDGQTCGPPASSAG
ncbi:MAG: MarR family winged helix-turn-helix transcriptional regulator [Actinomycetota bacterium]|nr:MarR family winged helix-turn-helix transcriptional regulator [Actinomycetota bacterium]